MLRTLAVANYRSLRDLRVPLGRLTLITGPNGSGKSSVYRALRLLADTAYGGVVRSLAREGGLPSVLWAGPEQFSAAMRRGEQPVEGTRRNKPVNLRLGFAGETPEDFGYAIDVGMPVPIPGGSLFDHDPEIKVETVWSGPVLRPSAELARRHNALLETRGDTGRWAAVERMLPPYASMLAEFVDPRTAPEMLALREQIRGWRFYDHFRTDAEAPARWPQVGTRTPVLGHDGADFAAAVATIREVGDAQALEAAVDDAFPGASLEVRVQDGQFEVLMRQPGLLRPLRSAELSDGTLRYLLWIAALLTPRPPPLLVLNEPEASLHPDLLPALARLVGRAAREAQVIVVSHASRLVAALEDLHDVDVRSVVLEKSLGETRILNLAADELPQWHWPAR
ncbi:AAA family ATPase [Ramlibacter humi]|uniref:ATP-binding protein n=1 Tax=Ramlibacter humi TaxID=2530451 RepID=A0A4Z0BKM8_9BURK|nr:AAA family ATPase [Ramlibacter humi]TFY98969.1 ATP-binding protein [Ramlibacter humi]